MTERVAFVMKLRKGVTKGEITELIELLDRIADPDWMRGTKTTYVDKGTPHYRDGKAHAYTPVEVADDRVKRIFKKYNDEWGDPTFYIP